MKFYPQGITQDEIMAEFRTQWMLFTIEENKYLTGGKSRGLSPLQQMTIDMYTGHNDGYEEIEEVAGILPAQMELESIFRARSRALATMIQRGRIST